MEVQVDRRAPWPDFTAGEAHFFQKLRAAFSALQTQCENEKSFNQHSFERNQHAIQKRIRQLETKCYILEKKRRDAEDAYSEASLELQQEKDKEVEGRKAHLWL
jgi:hypothetical protein